MALTDEPVSPGDTHADGEFVAAPKPAPDPAEVAAQAAEAAAQESLLAAREALREGKATQEQRDALLLALAARL